MKFILAMDQGTTSSRAIVFNHAGKPVASAQQEFPQMFPKPGWVELNPLDIWRTQFAVAKAALRNAKLKAHQIAAIGITNQRETTMVWNRKTGQPICNAIVWQDRRTSPQCERLRVLGLESEIYSKTGLMLDPYFSATKLQWISKHAPGAQAQAPRGELAFGTVDSWLIWNLTGRKTHVTDASNASRTMLLNLRTGDWDAALLKRFGVPRSMLPQICDSSGVCGEATVFGDSIPIGGVAGDQQAALFGQLCHKPGLLKNTYGTGCFLLMHTGEKPVFSKNKLLTTVAWRMAGKTEFALEGSVFIGGAIVQWLRDGLGLVTSSRDIEALAQSVPDNGGVYFVPALVGLGAPHWDPHARGLIAGLTRGTKAGHIARAALEGIAQQVADVTSAMQKDGHLRLKELRVDGGASLNHLLMQFQADLLGIPVTRSKVPETTALGAAYLAGLAVGYWENKTELSRHWQRDKTFKPRMKSAERKRLRATWQKALQRAAGWDRK